MSTSLSPPVTATQEKPRRRPVAQSMAAEATDCDLHDRSASEPGSKAAGRAVAVSRTRGLRMPGLRGPSSRVVWVRAACSSAVSGWLLCGQIRARQPRPASCASMAGSSAAGSPMMPSTPGSSPFSCWIDSTGRSAGAAWRRLPISACAVLPTAVPTSSTRLGWK